MPGTGPATHLPHRASAGGVTGPVRAARDGEDGSWTWELGGRRIPIDDPDDFASAVAPGVEVTIDYGRFALIVWRTDAGAIRYRGVIGDAIGAERADEERALWAALDQVGDAAAPRACFFCRWSEVEDGTSWGHLGCVLPDRAAYDRAATAEETRARKSASIARLRTWVDEWHGCDQHEVRPIGYGYRGRPKPA